MSQSPNKRKLRYPTLVVLLLMLSFAFGGATALVTYATGTQVAYNPKMFMVSHTEYRYGETGQVIARLVDFQGNPVTVQNCTASVLYPDKTYFIQDNLMATSTFSGDYWINFTTPTGPEGTYEYQATCTYASGTKTATVTNSFHLSSAFNSILGNLTEIDNTLLTVQNNLTDIQGDLTQLSTDLFAVNSSLSADIAGVSTQVSDLSNQLNTNMSTVFANFADIQTNFSTVFTELNNIDTTLSTEFSNIQTNFSTVLSQFSTIQSNFSTVLTNQQNIQNTLDTEFANIQANFTQVLNAIDNITVSVNLSQVLENQEQINTTLNLVSDDLTNFRAVYDGNVTLQNTLLTAINLTTSNTYDYVTGTLTTNIDNVLTQLGVINATVNRIETTTNQINSTVNDILTNQENAVVMSVFSG